MQTMKGIIPFSGRFAVIMLAIFHLGLPLYADLAASFLMALVLTPFVAAIITAASLLVGFALVNILYPVEVYYRAHEMLATPDDRYERNAAISIEMPFGDLFAMTQESESYLDIVEPRSIEFVTDSRGYRNREMITDADLVLIGDSFVVGHGLTQADIASEKLMRLTDQKVYNISFPGDPSDYEKLANKNKDILTRETKLILFYFEGNDFWPPTNSDHLEALPLYEKVRSLILTVEEEKTNYLAAVYPSSFGFVRAVRRKSLQSYTWIAFHLGNSDENQQDIYAGAVAKETVGNKSVAFLKSYVEVSKETDLETYFWKDAYLLDKINAVVFIPTKYRVYSDIGHNAALQALTEGYADQCFPIIDLTDALRTAAQENLSAEKYVYWRDDTHWNPLGVSVASHHLASQLRSMAGSNSESCR